MRVVIVIEEGAITAVQSDYLDTVELIVIDKDWESPCVTKHTAEYIDTTELDYTLEDMYD